MVLFQDGKEKLRRPAMSAKGTVVKFMFTKVTVLVDWFYIICKYKVHSDSDWLHATCNQMEQSDSL